MGGKQFVNNCQTRKSPENNTRKGEGVSTVYSIGILALFCSCVDERVWADRLQCSLLSILGLPHILTAFGNKNTKTMKEIEPRPGRRCTLHREVRYARRLYPAL